MTAFGLYVVLGVMAPWESPMWLKQLIGSAAAGAAFVAAGANTAPSRRFITALVLLVVHAVLYTAGFAFILARHSETVPIWWLAVCSVAALAGTVCMCVVLHKEEIQDSQPVQ